MGDIRICFLGDSFVNGTGDPRMLGWAGRLCADAADKAEITYYNLGVRRHTSGDILERWDEECTRRLIEGCDARLVVSFGVNDVAQQLDIQTTLDNTRHIIKRASARYKTLMVGPPPIDDESMNLRIRRLDHKLAVLCRDLEIPYLSVFEHLEENPTWRHEVASNDGAHPRAAGYDLLAGLVKSWDKWWFH